MHHREAAASDRDFEEALRDVRTDFFCKCHGLVDKKQQEKTAIEKLKLDVYYTLSAFELEQPFEFIERFDETSDLGFYESIYALRPKIVRLARFRHLTLEELRADEHQRLEKSEQHAETMELESLRDLLREGEQQGGWIDAHNRLCADEHTTEDERA